MFLEPYSSLWGGFSKNTIKPTTIEPPASKVTVLMRLVKELSLLDTKVLPRSPSSHKLPRVSKIKIQEKS